METKIADDPGHAQRGVPVIPSAVDERSSAAGLRAVAALESLKGILVLVLMFVVFAVHEHAADLAESLLFHLRLDTDWHISQAVMNAAYKLTSMRLLTIAAAAIAYASVRFIEAWGLWHRRVWAEWFALLTGAIYLPLEIQKVLESANWLHVTIFVANLTIVLYMLWVRVRSRALTEL